MIRNLCQEDRNGVIIIMLDDFQLLRNTNVMKTDMPPLSKCDCGRYFFVSSFLLVHPYIDTLSKCISRKCGVFTTTAELTAPTVVTPGRMLPWLPGYWRRAANERSWEKTV